MRGAPLILVLMVVVIVFADVVVIVGVGHVVSTRCVLHPRPGLTAVEFAAPEILDARLVQGPVEATPRFGRPRFSKALVHR